jgi:hypothetical protein
MSNTRNLAGLLNSSGLVPLPTKVAGVLPDANAPSGSVIQVVQVSTTTTVTITSTSFVDTGLSASITPTSASSKVLVIVSNTVKHFQQTNALRDFVTQIVRGTTPITLRDISSYGGTGANGYFETELNGSIVFLDSPTTASPVTYKTQAKISNASNDTRVDFNPRSSTGSIILMEIAA